MLEISLLVILILVLVLPITVHFVEQNIEFFLFVMGLLSVTFSHFFGSEPLWTGHLVKEALREPLLITGTVFVAGLLVLAFKNAITRHILDVEKFLGRKIFCFLLVTLLGFFSSVITAIMAAILLVEIVNVLKYDRKFEIKLVVLGCFSIGLGAALTPVGEPLSTICISKLSGSPYHAGFFFLLKNIGVYVIPGVIFFGAAAMFLKPAKHWKKQASLHENEAENIKDVNMRTVKVYLFIVALILLGTGFKPIVDRYIASLSSSALYWINILSAVMDNATLTAAEISPRMQLAQIQSALMGLLVAGGMLIPGNIPNIISAGRLGIRSKEWALVGVPFGLAVMAAYFVILKLML
jgi:predicted cation transporter